jgi:hypothetical protein
MLSELAEKKEINKQNFKTREYTELAILQKPLNT